MMRRAGLIACTLAVLLGGCTGYREAVLAPILGPVGHSANQIEPDIWRVTYTGHDGAWIGTLQTFWLYRCAELALERGYAGFVVLSNVDLVAAPVGDPLLHRVKDRKKDRGPRIVHREVYKDTYHYLPPRPVFEADIRLIQHPFEPAPPRTFDAAALKATLEPLVRGESCNRNSDICMPSDRPWLKPAGTSS